MSERCVCFRCDGETLVGVLHAADVPLDDLGVLVIVGGPQYRVGSHRQFVLMARALAKAGVPTFRFDYRGMGDSSGDRRDFTAVAGDLRAALDTFCGELPTLRRVVVFGLCDAASAALMHLSTDGRVCGLVIANPWVRSEAGAAKAVVRHYYGRRLLQRSFWSKVLTGEFRPAAALSGFVRLVRLAAVSDRSSAPQPSLPFQESMRQGFERLSCPVLLVLSERDLTAREFEDLCSAEAGWSRLLARPGVTRFRVLGADHTFSSRRDRDAVADRVVGWLHETFRGARAPSPAAVPPATK